MTPTNLDRLLTVLVVHLHSASVCSIGEGSRLAFAPFEAIIVHHVLAGSGSVRIGNGASLPYAPGSIIVVPPRYGHVIGDARPEARDVCAEDHCGSFADGLASFSAGSGPGTLLVCGSIPAPHGQAFGLFNLLHEVVEMPADEVGRRAFDLLRAEVAAPGLGTAAITEALMKTCLVALLRAHLRQGSGVFSSAALSADPRLARAVLAVLENPGAPHTVTSLAERAGMSRASFADHFARTLDGSPMDFVQKVRLRAAARLSANTDLPLKVIAAAVGYAGPTSLSRAFRGTYGTDVKAYRNAGKHGQPDPAGSQPDVSPQSDATHPVDEGDPEIPT